MRKGAIQSNSENYSCNTFDDSGLKNVRGDDCNVNDTVQVELKSHFLTGYGTR